MAMKQSTPRQVYEARFKSSRTLLLLIVVFTVVNIALSLLNIDISFNFSLMLPYLTVLYGIFFTGHAPDEAYYTEDGKFAKMNYPDVLLYIAIAVAVLVIAVYFVMWLVSKKRTVPLLVGTILYGCDLAVAIAALFLAPSTAMLFNLVFHCIGLVGLISGVAAGFKLRKMPADQEPENLMTYAVPQPGYGQDEDPSRPAYAPEDPEENEEEKETASAEEAEAPEGTANAQERESDANDPFYPYK